MCILKQKVARLLIKEIIMIKIKINKLKSKTVKRKYILKKKGALMYHVGMNSHDCFPVSIDQIIENIKTRLNEKQ